jgi:aminoglycoside/choline kinase family phosphotransferase
VSLSPDTRETSSPLPDEAARSVTEWLGKGWTAQPLAGDASVRAYYRITGRDGASYILAYYPEEVRPQLARFMGAYEALAQDCRVPEVLHHGELAVLQHDVGSRTIFDVLHEDREEAVPLYRMSIELLVAFQKAHADLNPAFTAEFFMNELEMAREFYVCQLMDVCDTEALKPALRMLCKKVARHPYVLCHRDFHGQNVHYFNDTVYLIDYQDLRMGPDTYDLASLLRDRGVARILGDETELELLGYYGKLSGADAGLRQRYFETLLQRSIKILGTFARQPIERGRMHYLEFIPPTLESVRRCVAELPEFAAIGALVPMTFDMERARERAEQLHKEI